MTITLYNFKKKFKKYVDYLDPDFSSREAKIYEYAEMLLGELNAMTGVYVEKRSCWKKFKFWIMRQKYKLFKWMVR